MKERGLPPAAWALLGLLVLAGVVLSLGKNQTQTDPQPDSYAPSGAAAFVQLLREAGYRVTITSSSAPALPARGAVVGFFNEAGANPFARAPGSLFGQLARFVKGGGRLLILPVAPEFADSSRQVSQQQITNPFNDKTLTVALRPADMAGDVLGAGHKSARLTLWQGSGRRDSAATMVRLGEGYYIQPQDGFIATNRFLDHESNADWVMNLVATTAGPSKQIIFLESMFAPGEPSLLEVLGSWAEAGWYQALFFFVVVVYTLGKRFGLPEEPRPVQTGQRELVNAVADTYQRARATREACRSAYESADREVRKALKLSMEAPLAERDQRIPPNLAVALRAVFDGTQTDLKARDAFERCQRLRGEMNSFLGESLRAKHV